MRIYLAGVAAIALAASGAVAQPNGKGNDKNGKPAAAKVHGNAKVQSGKKAANAKAAVRTNVRFAQNNNGNSGNKGNANKGNSAKKSDSRNNARNNGNDNANRGNDRKQFERPVERRTEQRIDRREEQRRADRREYERRADRREDQRRTERRVERRVDREVDRRVGRFVDRAQYTRDRRFFTQDRTRRLVAGCPPGLAKKYNGCLPPGQAQKRSNRYYGERFYNVRYRPSVFGLRNYSDGRYYYNDGYLLRRDTGGGIAGYIPLLGGALGIGQVWPSSYQSYAVPDYYEDYYNLGPANSYRYADNVIYRVDPEDSAIMSVAALLTGDDISIGQPMPRGYDVYNVPYGYRDRYYDTPQANYRYSDGYVYQIDPETRLVAAAIDLLV